MPLGKKLREWREEGRSMRREFFAVVRALFRAKQCESVAGVQQGFVTAFGPVLRCDKHHGHNGAHRAKFNRGAIEWPS